MSYYTNRRYNPPADVYRVGVFGHERCHLLPFIAAAAAGMIFSAERPIT